jgi:hypothetical protein
MEVASNRHNHVHEQLRDVLDALTAVQDAMGAASDIHHGRNFQLSTEAWAHTKARDAWNERRNMIQTLRTEILDLAVAIQEQKR